MYEREGWMGSGHYKGVCVCMIQGWGQYTTRVYMCMCSMGRVRTFQGACMCVCYMDRDNRVEGVC